MEGNQTHHATVIQQANAPNQTNGKVAGSRDETVPSCQRSTVDRSTWHASATCSMLSPRSSRISVNNPGSAFITPPYFTKMHNQSQ